MQTLGDDTGSCSVMDNESVKDGKEKMVSKPQLYGWPFSIV
jgi:hypothetical protein